MERFKTAITYIFKEKGWENKILPIYAVLVIATIVGGIISLSLTLPLGVMAEIMAQRGLSTENIDAISSAFSNISTFFTLPVMIYMYGYLIEVVRNISDGAKAVLVENKEIGAKLIKGAKLYVTLFLATLPTTLVGTFLIIISVFGAIAMFSISQSNPVFMVAGVALGLLTLVLSILILVLNSIISFSSLYIYFKTNSFRQAFTYKKIFETIRNNEKSLLNIFVDFLILGLIEFFFVIIFFIPLLCVSPFVFPMVTIISVFAKAYILADRFKMMSTMKD